MKAFLLSLFLTCLMLSPLTAKDTSSSKSISKPILSKGLLWADSCENAFAQAEKTGQSVVLLFTGADWCPYCTLLEKKILSKVGFAKALQGAFLFVYLDFPYHYALDSATTKRNEELRLQYNVESFPSLVVLDAKKNILGRLEYERVRPVEFALMLRTLRQAGSHEAR